MERREEMGDQIAKSDIHEGGGGEGERGWMGGEYQSLTSLKPTFVPNELHHCLYGTDEIQKQLIENLNSLGFFL